MDNTAKLKFKLPEGFMTNKCKAMQRTAVNDLGWYIANELEAKWQHYCFEEVCEEPDGTMTIYVKDNETETEIKITVCEDKTP